MNGGECVDGVDSFSCTCPPLYSGHRCEIGEYTISVITLDYGLHYTNRYTTFSLWPSLYFQFYQIHGFMNLTRTWRWVGSGRVGMSRHNNKARH